MRSKLFALLAGLALWPALTFGAAEPNCSILELNAHFSSQLSRVEAGKDALLRAHLRSEPAVDPAHTARFVDQVAFSDASSFHYEFGFVALKDMNYIDKNLGTAFSNLGQRLLMESFDEIKAKYPQLARLYKIHTYGDFKTLRIALEANGAEVLTDAQLNQIFSELTARTQTKLQSYIAENSLDGLPIPINSENWFVAGAGRSLDESALMARMCRGTNRSLCENGFSGFGSESAGALRQAVNQARGNLLSQHESLVTSVRQAGLSASVLNADGTLRREIIEVIRKNPIEPDDLAVALAPHLGVSVEQVSGDLVRSLQSYYSLVDRFQPAILVRERVRLEFPTQGGVSLDVRGMGALNFAETEAALLRTRNSNQIADILGEIRQGERVATEGFENVKSRLGDALGSRYEVRCSGDDCVATLRNGQELTPLDKQVIVERLSEAGLSGDFRMTFVPPGLSSTSSMWLASQLESIEKSVSAGLVGAFTPAEIRQITIAVDAPAYQGHIGLITSVQRGEGAASLAEKIRKHSELIQRLLLEAAEEFEGAPGWSLRVPPLSEASVVRVLNP